MIVINRCNDKQVWDDFVLKNNGNPLQLWGWGEVKAGHNWTAQRLFAVDSENMPIAGAQVLFRHLPWPFRSLAYIPRGPVLAGTGAGEFLSCLSDYIRKNYHSVVLTIEPDATEFVPVAGFKKSPNRILPAETIILDLTKSEDELMSTMAKKTRQYIRKSAASGLEIKPITTTDQVKACLDIYDETAKRAGFALHDRQYYIDVFEKMGENAQIFGSFVDDKLVAFLWLAVSASTAYELYGGMNDTGRDLRANYALKWAMICRCKKWGLDRYDFGGLIEGGVSTFKLGWAENETVLAGTFDKPLSGLYGFYSKVLPLAKKLAQKLKSAIKH